MQEEMIMNFSIVPGKGWDPESTSNNPSVHHLRPVSKGGDKNCSRNKTKQPKREHDAWHVLVQNSSAEDVVYICHILNACRTFLGGSTRYSIGYQTVLQIMDSRVFYPKPLPVILSVKENQIDAYQYLFREDVLDLDVICRQVNTYLDPRCAVVPIVV